MYISVVLPWRQTALLWSYLSQTHAGLWKRESTGHKKSSKIRHLGTIAQLCRAVSSQLKHVSTIGKKLVKQQYLLHMSSEYGPLSAEIVSPGVWGTPANFNLFHVLASLLQRRRWPEANQTLHDVWPSPGLVDYVYSRVSRFGVSVSVSSLFCPIVVCPVCLLVCNVIVYCSKTAGSIKMPLVQR